MANRVRDVPDDADWPEIEDELIPEHDPMPDAGGPFTRSLEYLHGARATLDADLSAPTRLLTAVAARVILRVADENDTEIEASKRDRFEAIAAGQIPDEQDDLIEALATLSAFVETQVQKARAGGQG